MLEEQTSRLSKTFPWARMAFDFEGLAAALGFWIVGLLLGLLWSPLFWLGFAAAVFCLLATRRAGRTAPVDAEAIVAPCDGVVSEVGKATAPAELRLPGADRVRVRISSSPAATTGVYAPMAGGIETLVREEGDPSRIFATSPDLLGLNVAYLSVSSGDKDVGMRLAAGGLGPRIDLDVESGDALRAGRRLGKRRLGGWCDIYLPADAETALVPGMTVVGGETRLVADGPVRVMTIEEPEAVEEEPAEVTEEEVDEVETETEDEDVDVSETVAKLRKDIESSAD